MAQQESRSATIGPVRITCDCATCEIDVSPDPMHARRGHHVQWTCDDGDRFCVEFEPNGPVVPPYSCAHSGGTIKCFVRPGTVPGRYKYWVYVFCDDKICVEDPDLIVDD